MEKETEKTPDMGSMLRTFSEEIKEVVSMKKEVEDGYYINTFYPFFPGILLFLNEVHATNIRVGTFSQDSKMILLNYCITGRCEFKTSTDRYRYLTDNDLSISGYVVRESFFYPTGYYVGFEVGIVEEWFTPRTWEVLEEFGIDTGALQQISDQNKGLYISEANSRIQRIWLDMYGAGADDPELIKPDLLKILRILSASKPEEDKKAVYLTKGQMELARAVHERLTRDISVHVSMREIAEELKVSESSLKKYFKIMFDMNVSEYMRAVRLKKAAKMLLESEFSVFDIADMCGYTNQGRFAKVFKEYYGVRPLEYRRLSTLNPAKKKEKA